MSYMRTFPQQQGGSAGGLPVFSGDFYAAANGDDSGAGTINDPVATPNKLLSLLTVPGTRGYFRRGDTFALSSAPTVVASGTVASPIEIGNYGDAAKPLPIWSGLLDIKGVIGDWTEVDGSGNPMSGTNRWKKTGVTAFSNHSCFLDGALANAESSSITNVNAALDWRHQGTDLYLFATANPATFYASIQIARAPSLFLGAGKKNIRVSGIHFQGAYNVGAIDSGDGENITFTDVEVSLCARSAMRLRAVGCRIERPHIHDIGFGTGLGEHGLSFGGPLKACVVRDAVIYNCREDLFQLRESTPLLDTLEPIQIIGGTFVGGGENAGDGKRGTLIIRRAYLECSKQHTITLHGEFHTMTMEDCIVFNSGSSLCVSGQEGSYVGSSNPGPASRGTRCIFRRNLFFSTSECIEAGGGGVDDDWIFDANIIMGTSSSGTLGMLTFRTGINHVLRHNYIRNRGNGQALRYLNSSGRPVHFAVFESNVLSVSGNTQAFYSDHANFSVSSGLKNLLRKTTNLNTIIRHNGIDYSGTQYTDGTVTAAIPNLGGANSIMTTTEPHGSAPAITSITRVGRVCTVTLTAHQLSKGQPAVIVNATEVAYNRPFWVTSVIDADTFTFELPEGVALPATPATGSPALIDLRFANGVAGGADTAGDQTAVIMDLMLDRFPSPARPLGPYATKRPI